jgi:hypothetical protein
MMKLEAPSGRHDDYVASGALFLHALLNLSSKPEAVWGY